MLKYAKFPSRPETVPDPARKYPSQSFSTPGGLRQLVNVKSEFRAAYNVQQSNRWEVWRSPRTLFYNDRVPKNWKQVM